MSARSALLIGSTRYQDSKLSRLSAPAGDLEALAAVLRTPSLGEFRVTVMLDRTWAEVMEGVARFFRDGGPTDTLLFYFSGHGLLDEKRRLYFASINTNTGLLSGSAVAASFVREAMDQSRSARQVVVLDCCHGGAFSSTAKGALSERIDTEVNFAPEMEGKGRVVLTATAATEYAFEGNKLIGKPHRSIFTHHMVEGLRTGDADLDGDGRITADELYTYVWKKVQSETNAQSPTKWAYGQTGDIVLSRSTSFRPRPDLIDQAIVEDVSSQQPSRRFGAMKALMTLAIGSHRGVAKASIDLLRQSAVSDDSISIRGEATSFLSGRLPEGPHKPPILRRRIAIVTALVGFGLLVFAVGAIVRRRMVNQSPVIAQQPKATPGSAPNVPPQSATNIATPDRPEPTLEQLPTSLSGLSNGPIPAVRRKERRTPSVVGGDANVRGSLDGKVIHRIIRHHINEVKYCYEQELSKIPKLDGRIMVQFTIAASGQVIASVLQNSTMDSARVENCTVQAVRRWEFPKPIDGGIVIVSYPFVFTSSVEKAERLTVTKQQEEAAAVPTSIKPDTSEGLEHHFGPGPLSKSDVVSGMNSVKPKVAACYNQFKVPGLAMIRVVIGKSGEVSSATVSGKFAGTPTGSCVEKAISSAAFPQSSDGMMTPYPFQLK